MIAEPLRSALAECAQATPLLVACDYDGTLSPLVDDPAKAVPHGPALDALIRLAAIPGIEAFLISGRSLPVLRSLTGGPAKVTLIGTHGSEMEGDSSSDSQDAATQSLVADLRSIASLYPGTVLEEKTVGAALHYRHAADPEQAVAAVGSVAARHGARVIEGKLVLEVLLGNADKGSALEQIRKRIGAKCMVFIGDDTTDEDVFVTLGGQDVGIKVGEGPTAAAFRVADPAAVAEALATIVASRQSSGA